MLEKLPLPSAEAEGFSFKKVAEGLKKALSKKEKPVETPEMSPENKIKLEAKNIFSHFTGEQSPAVVDVLKKSFREFAKAKNQVSYDEVRDKSHAGSSEKVGEVTCDGKKITFRLFVSSYDDRLYVASEIFPPDREDEL